MTYDHWKTTNPEDEFMGPTPEEQSEKELCAEYDSWTKAQGLPSMSAEDLSCELDYERASSEDPLAIGRITIQVRWLADFIRRWDEALERGEGR